MPPAKKRKAREHEARMKQLRLWGIVGAVVLLLAVTAVVLSLGGSDGSTTRNETGPVSVSGAPLPSMPASGADPAIGMAAPTITGASFDGAPLTIDPGASGRPMAVWFVAHWCPHCQAEVPRIVALDQRGQFPEGVDSVAVSTSVNTSAPNYPPSAWLSTAGWPFPVLADDDQGTAGQAYGLGDFPYLVLVDAHGDVVSRNAGELGEEGLSAALQSIATG